MSGAKRAGLVILISGTGRNLNAIIQAQARGQIDADIRAVISNRAAAPGLAYARAAHIETHVLKPVKGQDRAHYDARLAPLIDAYNPDIVALAGFMRILSSGFVHHYSGRLVNIHPSLLPKYRGLDTHRKAIAAGDSRHGASVHFVTTDLDAGPVILQGSITVETGDTPERLAERLMHKVETRIYPQALEWIASGRAKMRSHGIEFDGQPLKGPINEHFT